jgi:hypothetical protein
MSSPVPTVRSARIAGLLYALMGLPAPFSLIYIPNKLIVAGNAAATAGNVSGHEMLFRAGIGLTLASAVGFIFLVLALYRLLSGVDKAHAALMVVLVSVSVAVTFLNEVNNIAALTLFRGADYLSVFDQPQREALGLFFLRLHHHGLIVDQIFWGLWLFPFGLLVMRSRFLPRALGLLLLVNGMAYVAVSVTSLVAPDFLRVVSLATLPALLGELWIMLWLLIKGVRVPPPIVAA